MRTIRFYRLLAAALAPIGGLSLATPAAAYLVLNFDNDRPDASTLPAYITFAGAPAGDFDATNILTGAPLQEGVSYSLSTLKAGVDVTQYTSGRVFVSLGSPLTGLSAVNNFTPNFVAPTVSGLPNPNFLTRMDKYEITYGVPPSGGPPTGGANLSATDFFGIPLQLQTTGGAQPKTLTWNYNGAVNTAAVFQHLGALENFATDSASNTAGALVANGANGVTVGSLNGVVRIIAPTSTNPPASGSSTPYPSLAAYVSYLTASGNSTTIQGQNGKFPNTNVYQDYKFTGVISKTTGDLTLTGSVTGVPNTMTIVIPKAGMTSYEIFGANPTPIPGNPDPMKVVEKIIADYFAGLNFGLIGSKAANPNMPGQTIGNSPSWTWYGNKPDGGGPSPLPQSDAFVAAQPANSGQLNYFYNAYAAYLNGGAPVTAAYGFPYTDRLASPLATLDDNTVLTMTILGDTTGSPSSPWVITVPAPTTETFADVLVGPTPSSMLTVTGGGTAILSGENAYSGGTTIIDSTTVKVTNSNPGISSSIGTGELTLDNGILEAGANNLAFSNAVTLTTNGGTFDTNGNTLAWNGVISGDGGLTKVGPGTLILGSANTYAGGTVVDGGTLGLAANGALGSGGVAMQPGTTLQFEADGLTLPNEIVLNADPTIDTGSNTDTISGVISGSGSLDKIGSGTLILTAANTYTGPTDVQAGTLGLRGSLSSIVTVESGATLGGTGTIMGLIANSGATVAPGVFGPYATFTVTGQASFAAGSTFAVDVGSAGQSDKLVTVGTTTISGGTVAVNGVEGAYLPSARYTLMTAEGGLSGAFSSVSSNGYLATLAFLEPVLSYDADDVYLGFGVKPFVSAAQTPNQAATALALEFQPAGSPLYDALISQTKAGALTAFNTLSGEIHASAVGAAFDDTRLPREAVLDRLAESYGAPAPAATRP